MITDSPMVNAAKFPTLADAEAAVIKLVAMGIPTAILGWDNQPVTTAYVGECYVWVPEDLVDDATEVLNPPSVSEEELTKLALQSPPPDDL
jgi:hypothetical protein